MTEIITGGQIEILKRDALGRISVPKKKRDEILDTFERSGMSGQAFAKHIALVLRVT